MIVTDLTQQEFVLDDLILCLYECIGEFATTLIYWGLSILILLLKDIHYAVPKLINWKDVCCLLSNSLSWCCTVGKRYMTINTGRRLGVHKIKKVENPCKKWCFNLLSLSIQVKFWMQRRKSWKLWLRGDLLRARTALSTPAFP